ncbi:hypothetical protein AH04_55 [Erwinia phage AH04]|uniref:Uncharacterized protein n=1 Tax=Erwinia phage AH04 TaxID=2869569 RepID=A0AAE7X0U7_9CAUD|nr:hypothetical protein PQC02_gp259 [Erwinia phage AH04]QZA70538.1 hypothetical protein AH04_55 [Erwinia phage AH04]
MYNVESRTLKTEIGILLYSSVTEDKKIEEIIAYYYPLLLDMMVNVLNNRHRSTEDAIFEELKKYYDDPGLQLFYGMLYEEIRMIKKQFIIAGFDPRLKYKLVERTLPRSTIKLHAICMDLEATMDHMLVQPETGSDNQDVSDAVIDNPTIDQLESYFDKR